uniref:Uncharacterized protein n=1 Tax=Anguilla anguilla TaxID=7936 RepID=A0A0E9VKH7_ANGAN
MLHCCPSTQAVLVPHGGPTSY